MLFFLVLLLSTTSGKRCRGRMWSGGSCATRCNYETGQWEDRYCGDGIEEKPQNWLWTCSTIAPEQYQTIPPFCQFPFMYEGVWMETCILKNSVNNAPWCPTRLDANNEMVLAHFAECDPENDVSCREIPSKCSIICESASEGVTTCSYEYSGGSKLGISNPRQFGNCSESYQRSPCYINLHDPCNFETRQEEDMRLGQKIPDENMIDWSDVPVAAIGYQWCNQCNSYKDALCSDPFYYEDNDEMNRANDHTFYQPCAGMKEICTKVSLDVHGNKSVIRSCGTIRDDHEDEDCYTTVLDGKWNLVCQCEENGCNSARM